MADDSDVIGPDGEGTTWGLVMPYVVCQSNGGMYDDAAFVAGSTFGRIDAQLQAAKGAVFTMTFTVKPELVPQLDLLAMHHGCKLETEDVPYGYVQAVFTG